MFLGLLERTSGATLTMQLHCDHIKDKMIGQTNLLKHAQNRSLTVFWKCCIKRENGAMHPQEEQFGIAPADNVMPQVRKVHLLKLTIL